jgi:DNA-binding response OmpR family regulator
MSARILVIEDDPSMLKMVESHLRVAGFEVKGAADGFAGLKLAKEWNPELVLLDIMMPGMDGYTTCRRIREFSSVPIIILTARGEEDDLVRGLDAGADDYVVKPYSASELLARVRAVLRRVDKVGLENYHHKTFRHGDLYIDVDRVQVTVGGEEVNLTATEFRLLVTLADAMGRVLSAEDLLASVWGSDYRHEKAILWVTLSRLRQKIEPDSKRPIHVITRQGVGYMMPEEV